jgi:hypothetical protein
MPEVCGAIVSRADKAIAKLEPLAALGYRFEEAGKCIRAQRRGTTTYVMIDSIMRSRRPVEYVMATFSSRW